MATGKVTAESVNALKPEARDYFLWDDKVPGFGVKVTPAGQKIYVLQYRLGGRGSPTKRYRIGREGPWRPEKARTEAKRLRQLIDQGEDIQAQARDKVRVATDLAFKAYVERFAETKLKADWPKSWREVKRALELHAVAHWKDKPLPSITRADCERLLARLDERPASRHKLYAILSYLFNKAVRAGDIASSPLDAVDAPPTVAARAHTLDSDELRWFWLAAGDLPEPYGDLYRMAALLGQRRGEIAGMDWRELKRSAGEWLIPAERAKNGEATIVPLPSSVVAMLDKRAGGERWPRLGLVMPSGAGTAVSGFSKTKAKLDAKVAKLAKAEGATVRPWRIHDLRRTLATNLQALGTPYEVVEHLLNHKERTRTGIGKVYQTHGFKPEKRLALDRWEAELQRVVADKPQTVVPFKATA